MDREVPSPSVAVHGWDEQLRARGYRVTPQRHLVLEAVARLDHATPEEIGAQVQQTARGVNISTIYRTLELLEQEGLLTRTHFHDRVAKWHRAEESKHHHLICERCGQVVEIPSCEVEEWASGVAKRRGFVATGHQADIFGLCATCKEL